MKKIICIPLFIFSIFCVNGQQVTWSKDIACIVYSHCSNCHNGDNSLAPRSLMSYDDVYAIRYTVEIYSSTGTMPPAMASSSYSHIKENKKLSAAEISLVSQWALGDALRGDSTKEPAAPVFTEPASILPHADLALQIPLFTVPDSAGHYRKTFIMTPAFGSTRYIKNIEVVPGNVSAVHGVYVYADTSVIPVQLDAADPGDGYEHFFGTGSNSAKLLYGWVPGSSPLELPADLALKIDAGSRIIMQLEYTDEAAGKQDSSRLNIVYDTASLIRNTSVLPLLNHEENLLNGPLTLPIGSVLTFNETAEIKNDLTLLSIAPNLHNKCRSFKVYAVLPGNDTVGLLQVDKWEAVWSEGTYWFKNAIHLPQGSMLYASALYNNTVINLHDPKDTLKVVHAGVGVDDEEMIFSFTCLPYQPGDENIIQDSLPHYPHYNNCVPEDLALGTAEVVVFAGDAQLYPNPVTHTLFVKTNARKPVMVRIYNLMGNEVLKNRMVNQAEGLDLSMLPPGMYVACIMEDEKLVAKKFVKE